MTERRLPAGYNTADENDIVQKGSGGIWYTRGLTELVRPTCILEDFKTDQIIYSAGNEAWDERWATNATGLLGNVGPFTGAVVVGFATFTNASGSAITATYRKALDLFEMVRLRRIACRMRINSIAPGMGFRIGTLFSSLVPGIDACFEPATSANWLLQTGAGFTNVNTGVPVVINTFYDIDLRHDGASNYTLSINGSAPVVPVTSIPALSTPATLEWVLSTPNSGANRAHQLDYIYAVFDTPGRGF